MLVSLSLRNYLTKEKAKNENICQGIIWLKMMRMHIDLKICHFLLLTVSISEAGKLKNKLKIGIHGPSLCRGSTTKQYLFHRVLKKKGKKLTFLEPLMAIGTLLTQD